MREEVVAKTAIVALILNVLITTKLVTLKINVIPYLGDLHVQQMSLTLIIQGIWF